MRELHLSIVFRFHEHSKRLPRNSLAFIAHGTAHSVRCGLRAKRSELVRSVLCCWLARRECSAAHLQNASRVNLGSLPDLEADAVVHLGQHDLDELPTPGANIEA